VATRAGGTGSVVVDGENGYLRPIGDIGGLAGGLATLARDPKLRERLGRRGAEDVRSRFTIDRMADELDAVYRRLLR
jgi:glycosyltransferase involved in cell wall biosynthesis